MSLQKKIKTTALINSIPTMMSTKETEMSNSLIQDPHADRHGDSLLKTSLFQSFFQFLISNSEQYFNSIKDVAEKRLIEEHGSYDKAQQYLKDRIDRDGEEIVWLDSVMPVREWNSEDINKLLQLQHVFSLNDILQMMSSRETSEVLMSFKGISKSSSPLARAIKSIGLNEWLKKPHLKFESLERDLGLSKNTRRIWLTFFFGIEALKCNLPKNKPHKFYGRKLLTPLEYVEIWKKFVEVSIKEFELSREYKIQFLEK